MPTQSQLTYLSNVNKIIYPLLVKMSQVTTTHFLSQPLRCLFRFLSSPCLFRLSLFPLDFLLLLLSGCRKRSITCRIVECFLLNGFVYMVKKYHTTFCYATPILKSVFRTLCCGIYAEFISDCTRTQSRKFAAK